MNLGKTQVMVNSTGGTWDISYGDRHGRPLSELAISNI